MEGAADFHVSRRGGLRHFHMIGEAGEALHQAIDITVGLKLVEPTRCRDDTLA